MGSGALRLNQPANADTARRRPISNVRHRALNGNAPVQGSSEGRRLSTDGQTTSKVTICPSKSKTSSKPVARAAGGPTR